MTRCKLKIFENITVYFCVFEKSKNIAKSVKFYETSWNLVSEVSWNFMKLFSISKKAETSQP